MAIALREEINPGRSEALADDISMEEAIVKSDRLRDGCKQSSSRCKVRRIKCWRKALDLNPHKILSNGNEHKKRKKEKKQPLPILENGLL